MEASQHSLLAACFTLHSINAPLAIVPQRGAGLWKNPRSSSHRLANLRLRIKRGAYRIWRRSNNHCIATFSLFRSIARPFRPTRHVSLDAG
jgi:hypothetical protein